MNVLAYLLALAVAYLLVAVIANRQLGKHLPLPAFIANRIGKPKSSSGGGNSGKLPGDGNKPNEP